MEKKRTPLTFTYSTLKKTLEIQVPVLNRHKIYGSFGYIICIYIGDPIIKRALNPLNRFSFAIYFVPVQNRDLDFQGLFKC
jgi:hypothetical protein